MKVTINIDCTPEEARSFMGLPDVTALNEKLTEQMAQSMGEMSPEKLMQLWGPAYEQMGQQMAEYWTKQSK